MELKNRPITWTSFPNGEVEKTNKNHSSNDHDKHLVNEEHDIQIPVIVHSSSTIKSNSHEKKKPNNNFFKPFFLALVAAFFVGALLGTSFLKVLGFL